MCADTAPTATAWTFLPCNPSLVPAQKPAALPGADWEDLGKGQDVLCLKVTGFRSNGITFLEQGKPSWTTSPRVTGEILSPPNFTKTCLWGFQLQGSFSAVLKYPPASHQISFFPNFKLEKPNHEKPAVLPVPGGSFGGIHLSPLDLNSPQLLLAAGLF